MLVVSWTARETRFGFAHSFEQSQSTDTRHECRPPGPYDIAFDVEQDSQITFDDHGVELLNDERCERQQIMLDRSESFNLCSVTLPLRKPHAGAEELQQQVKKEPEQDEKAGLIEQERIALQQRRILAMERLDLLRIF
jgi:hypothetical protein